MYKKYQTKDLLKCLGVPRDTLRFYEKKGLLNPHKDSENNYRNYDETYTTLKTINGRWKGNGVHNTGRIY